jgi:hypothetical protein
MTSMTRKRLLLVEFSGQVLLALDQPGTSAS